MTVDFLKSLTGCPSALVALAAAASLGLTSPAAIAQSDEATPDISTDAMPAEIDAADNREIVPLNPQDLRPLVSETDFSLSGLERSIDRADAEIAAEDYDAAYETLLAARQTSNDLAGHYQKLSGQFSGIDNRIYDEHRRRALAAAQFRDAATYRLAIAHQGRGRAELAVPLLLQVLASQSPTRDLGRDAYNQLYDLGFVEVPFQRDTTGSEATPADRPLSGGFLTTSGLSQLLLDADTALSAGDDRQAIERLREARQLANELSGFYQQLTGSFSGIDNDIYQTHRTNALDTAQIRDEATYKLAVMFRAADAPELAVPLLMEVINSQSPTRDLGKEAYRQLYELGFVDTNYPRGQG